MNITEFEKRAEAGHFYVGQRVWFFGAKYQANWGIPGVHIPLTEGEIMFIYRNGDILVAYISEKTGRPLQSKYLQTGRNHSVKGGFNRAKEIQIFETKEEALETYRTYVQTKAEEIRQIIEEKTAKYYQWMEELEAPLATEGGAVLRPSGGGGSQ